MPRPVTRAQRLLQRFIIRLSGGRRLTVTLRARPRLSRALLILLGAALAKPALALDPGSLPTGGQVVAGQAGIQQSGQQLTVNQASDKTILNWQSFNIGSAASVAFNQPGASSVALNRVIGNDASQIHGKLQANGQVFISNPNGVLFGAGSQVDVGGLVATTLGLGDAQFMQGRYTLTGDSQAEIANAGQIRAEGAVALVAATVRNEGSIQARDVALAAGSTVSLDLNGDGLLSLKVNANALRGEIANGGAIQAGNQVIMAAATADALAGSVVNNSGIVRATGLSVEGGRISLSGGLVSHTGSLDASATSGGQIQIAAHTLMDAGQTRAAGTAGSGGTIRVEAQQITQTSSARVNVDSTTAGGSIHLQGGSGETGKVYSSASLSAQGTGANARGGSIAVTADSTQLRAATLDASGQAGGGSIEVGGSWQGGNSAVANARETGINASTTLKADAKVRGDGGSVVVWSDEKTTFAGHISATGGSQSGNGGKLEVSGKDRLVFAGTVNTASPFGLGGSLLLDPKNITISDAGGLFETLNLDDPNAGAGNLFGWSAVEVGSGNIAITAQRTDIGGISNVGAVYLFDGQSGALISALHGNQANDQVGSGGITALGNGNYVVRSTSWDGNKGAVTWGNGTSGVTGTVSAANSLVGSTADDQVGNNGITVLSNGNYVVSSSHGGRSAVTWGNGNGGTGGAVSTTNSLVGNAYDPVGSGGITALSDGNYVVSSYYSNRGALTWLDGSSATATLNISASNSLVGAISGDSLGSGGITELGNGHYAVSSPGWNGGRGAVTWLDGSSTTGTLIISASNSLVGSTAFDLVGNGRIIALSNGNYVVSSYQWDGTKGAVTWGDGNGGTVGAVSAANSLVGSTTYDIVGAGGITALSNGNYVVSSYGWDSNKGAVTWGNGNGGTVGAVSAANSLTGSNANDRVGYGGITALSNGNYVVSSYQWGANKGAVTWGNGDGGTVGAVSASNSLVGSMPYYVGIGGIAALSNGDYVISSYSALTRISNDSTTGTLVIGSNNSQLGSFSVNAVTTLSDGRVLARQPNQWVNGIATGRVSLVDFLSTDLSGITFSDNLADNLTLSTYRLAAILNAGTDITLQANNDILLNSTLTLNNPSGNGGHLTLQAGRNITFNASLNTDNGDLTAVAGDPGALAAQRDPGTPTITLANGVTLNIGTGTATLAAIGGDFINNAGNNAIQTSGAGRYLVYSNTPTATLEGLSSYNRHYNQGFTLGSVPTYAGSGSWFLYSIAPVLTVTPNASSQTYGDLSLAGLGYGLSGFIDGDNEADAGISGTASFTSDASASSNVGSYNLAYASGLASSLGYTFADAAASLGELNITQRLITLAASTASKVYGNLDPTLAATISAGSLGNGDSLADVTGTLGREAGENVGSYDLTLGSGLKAGNYSISFNADNNAVSITPRAITVAATAASKVYGNLDPTLAATISAGSLGNGDSLADVTGSLSREAGENVGSYDVTLGSGLKAGNYSISFDADNNALTITPRAITVAATAVSKVYGNIDPALAATISAGSLGNGDSLADVTGTLGREAGENVGSYDLTLGSGLKAGNYSISFNADNNAVSITPRAITVAATAASKVYGNLDPTLAATISAGSLGNGDSLADVTGSLSHETGENVGSYDVTLGSGLKAGNYSITFDADNNAISITPRDLFVQAQNASRPEGEVNPAFAANFSGWAFNDGLADLHGNLSFSTPATQASVAGDYAINAFGLTSTNYQILFSDGTLSVLASQQPAPPLPAGEQSNLVTTQVAAQTSTLLGDINQVTSGAGTATGTTPLPTNPAQWLNWITRQVMAWNAPATRSEPTSVPASTPPSAVSAATLLASNEDEQLGGLITRNEGVRLP